MKLIYFLLVSVCLLMACKTAKKTISRTTNNEQIRFGHGGGFTGAVTEYCLKQNGDLYKKALGDISKLSISQKEGDRCFSKCDSIQFREIELDNPGNRYAYIAHHRNDSIHRVTWNPHQPNLSPSLVEFHNMLLALVGEEPMTILPEESPAVEGDQIKKKEMLKKLGPLKKKSNGNIKDPLKQVDSKKLKKKNAQKIKKSKM